LRSVPKPPRRLSGALLVSFGHTKETRGVGVGTPHKRIYRTNFVLSESAVGPADQRAKFLFFM
jgi:hypothetical protein